MTLLPPNVVHDGRAATTAGFTKRVLYLDPDVVDLGLIGRAVDRPTIADPDLAVAVRSLHDALWRGVPLLEADTRLALVAERLATHLRGPSADRGGRVALRPGPGAAWPTPPATSSTPTPPGPSRSPPSRRRSMRRPPTSSGPSPGGSDCPRTPTWWRRRVEAARRMLLAGRPPAEVAATVGFHDQAHLTRQFRRHVGTTPGRFGRPGG